MPSEHVLICHKICSNGNSTDTHEQLLYSFIFRYLRIIVATVYYR